MNHKLVKPDFNRCLVNLTASIQQHFGVTSQYPPLDFLAPHLEGCKHVVLVLLDGMGKAILQKYVKEKGFLRQHHLYDISSIFPPTTVAATTALLSGKLPGETAWVGWQQYFAADNAHVVMFTNEEYYKHTKLVTRSPFETLAYQPFYNAFENVVTNALYPAFKENGFSRFSDMANAIVDITKNNETSFTYAYWDEPDALIHCLGTNHRLVQKSVRKLNRDIRKMMDKLANDTCLIVTADHGLVDVEAIGLDQHPHLLEHCSVLPALEGRATAFYVNDKDRFRAEFNALFSEWFVLYDTLTLCKQGLIGFPYDKALPFLGDFVAIAIDKYFFTLTKSQDDFKGAHAGLTADEVLIPLIVYRK